MTVIVVVVLEVVVVVLETVLLVAQLRVVLVVLRKPQRDLREGKGRRRLHLLSG